jgi:2-polyprenyl-3-methyl-5-hydroxy-6-metoxy-1,4-benzoquinol methylase
MTLLKMLHEIPPPVIWRAAKKAFKASSTNGAEAISLNERDSIYYDSIYMISEEYRMHYSQSRYYFLWSFILGRMHPKQSDHIIDIGCGPGQFAAFLRDQGIINYLGIDFSNETIKLAKLACPEFRFEQEDIFNTSLLKNMPYNIAICTEFLEHIREDTKVLEMLRSGTHLFASVPDFSDPGHLRYFQQKDEVTNRYAHLFSSWKCDVLIASYQSPKYYVFDGILR